MSGWKIELLRIVLLVGVTAGRIQSLASPFLKESFQLSSSDVLLEELITGPLRGRDIFLFVDEYTRFSMPTLPSDANTILMATHKGFNVGHYPNYCLRGSSYIAILLFSRTPSELFHHLSLSAAWNPTFLLLINMNATQSSMTILDHEVVQRSKHLVLLQPFNKGTINTFLVLTSFPFRARPHAAMSLWHKTYFRSDADLFLDRHPNMEGATLRLGSWCDDYPFIYLRHPSDDQCVGANLDTLTLIAAKLNFSYEVQKETQDQNWGALENGRWTGMLGDLVYNNKHLVINLFLVNYERWRDFDTTYPYHAEGFGFLAPLPPPVPQWKSITYPFTGIMWLAVIACTLIVSLLSALLPAVMEKDSVDYVRHILMVYGGILRQAVQLRGVEWLAAWWLSCIIITTAYTTNLVAFLTVPVYPTRMETVAELAQSHLRLTMQDYGNFVPAALKESSDQSLAALGNKLDLFTYELEYDPGFRGIRNREQVLIETYSYLSNLQMQYNATRYSYLMKEQIYSGHSAWFLPKNTPYTTKFSHLLTRLRETGILYKFFIYHFPPSDGQNQPLQTHLWHTASVQSTAPGWSR
ncbi:hypothetical protein O3P69_015305 [Scylla paramamosain]|uniref:Ionotropic glutamate receptor L-glutamate and glycine-binding domain-containing protein n=1 Tax=Scylla paramamosain TaxID=85552 RepID=A0AAW0T667_SCYPA